MKDDARLSVWLGRIFTTGLLATLCFFVAGFVWLAANGDSRTGTLRLSQLLPSLIEGDPMALVSLSLVVLLVTPLVAVIASLVYFLRRKEHSWTGVSLALLAVLAASIVAGLI